MMKYSLFALIPFLLLACSGKNEEVKQQLTGKWKYDAQAIIEKARTQENLTDSDVTVIEGAMGLYKDAVFNLKEEDQLELVIRGASQVGTWNITDNGKVLVLNLNGQDQRNPIESISSSMFVLKPVPELGIKHQRIFVPVTSED